MPHEHDHMCEICHKNLGLAACITCGRSLCDGCYPNLMEPCKLCPPENHELLAKMFEKPHPGVVVGSLWKGKGVVGHIWELDMISSGRYWVKLYKRDPNAPFDGMGVGFRHPVGHDFFEERATLYMEPT